MIIPLCILFYFTARIKAFLIFRLLKRRIEFNRGNKHQIKNKRTNRVPATGIFLNQFHLDAVWIMCRNWCDNIGKKHSKNQYVLVNMPPFGANVDEY